MEEGVSLVDAHALWLEECVAESFMYKVLSLL